LAMPPSFFRPWAMRQPASWVERVERVEWVEAAGDFAGP
jgi:hypothetical protein